MRLAAIALLAGCSSPDEDPVPVLDTGSEVTTTPELPAWCPAQTAGWQTIDESPQSPWGVRHPDEPDAPTVVFLPGGSGQDMEAEMTRASFLDGADGLGAFRVVMPIAEGSKSAFDPARVAKIRAEVLRCFGGADDIVHLAGHSNGGLAAFETALDKPGKWRTLLTVPGGVTSWDEHAVEEALTGVPVFLGVGDLDPWRAGVEGLHEDLVGLGLDSELVVFEDTNHIPPPGWPGRDVLTAWWHSHTP